jgi:hypothetical protein
MTVEAITRLIIPFERHNCPWRLSVTITPEARQSRNPETHRFCGKVEILTTLPLNYAVSFVSKAVSECWGLTSSHV